MIIVIDGPSGTGKSTVAKEVAKGLGFTFFDTGAMYRAFAWMVRGEKIDPSEKEKVLALLPRFSYEIRKDDEGKTLYFCSNQDVTEAIREPEVAPIASRISIYPEVRLVMTDLQRKLGTSCNAVFEGRDMGTVVFPKADLKIFLTADSRIRAERRYEELLLKFPDLAPSLHFETILKEIEERDRNDSTREVAPLKQASDAHRIDTSGLPIESVVNAILRLVPKKKVYPPMKWSYWIVYFCARLFFKLCFRLKIHGLSHFRPGAGIIVANHTSNFDPPVLSISCPEEVHFLAKESLFRILILGRWIKNLNAHPVSRTGTDLQTFRMILQLIEEKRKVILFPEGTRSPDGEIRSLERGLSFIVQKSKAPIFPAYIDGTFSAWPIVKKFPKLFGKITIAFGSPIEWEEFERFEKREREERILQRTLSALRDLKRWFDGGAEGSPP